jgi:predicted RNA binding protein YcfA (HicA-like mRNA interferase family)
MRLPRDVSGADLIKALKKLGYVVTRQKGSHARITTQVNGEHHETIPHHSPLKPGLLLSILKSIAAHHEMSVHELTEKINL